MGVWNLTRALKDRSSAAGCTGANSGFWVGEGLGRDAQAGCGRHAQRLSARRDAPTRGFAVGEGP